MLLAAVWLLGCLATGRAGAEGADSVHARLECNPARAEIGQPVEWVLTVEHPREIAVKLPEKDPVLDETWVVLDERSVVKDPSSAGPGRTLTRATWRVLALEPGQLSWPAIEVEYEADGVPRTVTAVPAVLEVRGELGADENEPRPMKGFHPPPPGAEGAQRWPWIVAATVLAAAVGAWILRRSRKKPAALPRASALDRLAELERAISADPGAGRSVTYDLSRLLRGSVDAFVRESHAGLTDADWTARVEKDERVPLGVRSASARLLRESEQVKYALHVPTRFAVDEMLRDARHALEALAEAPKPQLASDAPGAGKEAA